MNSLKIVMAFIAYAGVVMILLGITGISYTALSYLQSSAYSWSQPFVHEWDGLPLVLGLLIAIPGVLMVLIGGIIARPRYLWPILIVIGFIFCISIVTATATPPIKKQDYELSKLITDSFLISLPGIFCIIEGIVILLLRKKRHMEPNIQVQHPGSFSE